jgi:hypothetical protein
MSEKWELIGDLLGGTVAMRGAGEKWLPKESKENEIAYRARLQRSFLYPAFADTVNKLVSKPFAQPVVVEHSDALPDVLQGIEEDTDLADTSLSAFARDVFDTAVAYGLCHVLVDYPRVNAGATLADERQVGARPFFVLVKPTNLIGWRTTKSEGGGIRLTQVRIYECTNESVGEWGEQKVEYVRVYNESTWEVWRKTSTDKEYIKTDEGNHTYPGVPLHTFYTDRTGFMTADPCLFELAELNVAHWQSMSDQRNIPLLRAVAD